MGRDRSLREGTTWVPSMRGHFWTIYPYLREAARRAQPTRAEPWSLPVADAVHGNVRLHGWMRQPAPTAAAGCRSGDAGEERTVTVVVHGLGGGPRSAYCTALSRELLAAGNTAVLDYAMRGADGHGEDFYHGGLSQDLDSVVGQLSAEGFGRVRVVGFSVGGHVALRLATECRRPELDAVVAVCPPLDLAHARAHIDSRPAAFYRRRVLAGLVEQYAAVAARSRAPTPVAEVRRVRTVYDWDRLTVVPRYGFGSPDEYYAAESVAPRLARAALRVPALLVLARHDPIVPAAVTAPHVPEELPAQCPGLDLRWADRGGHLGFPSSLDLGIGPRKGLSGQLRDWFESAPARP